MLIKRSQTFYGKTQFATVKSEMRSWLCPNLNCFTLEALTMTLGRYDCHYKEGNYVIISHATSKLRENDMDMSSYNHISNI